MVMEALVAYAHYAAMILIALFLVLEYLNCTPGISAQRIAFLARIDIFYMLAAILAFGTGIARLVWFGKGPTFYLHNPVLYIKLALFIAVGLMSIPPTLQILRWKKGVGSGPDAPAPWQVLRVRRYLLVELALFALIPLMAVLLARGIGAQLPTTAP